MNSHRISAETWSAALQQQTRDALEEMPCTPDGLMHFKHKQHGYATAELADLICDQFKLFHQDKIKTYNFASAEEMISAGWCLD